MVVYQLFKLLDTFIINTKYPLKFGVASLEIDFLTMYVFE